MGSSLGRKVMTCSSIIAEGFRTLTEGEEVEFELAETENGYRAANVVRA